MVSFPMVVTSISVRERLLSLATLPALPAVVAELTRLTDRSSGSVAEAARVLAGDQVLTARVLRLANSAFYSPREVVRSPRQAVLMLGLSTVRSIALKAAVLSAFPLAEAKPLWRHALVTACAARSIARLGGLAGTSGIDEVFVMGLLHDLGKLALIAALGPEVRLVLEHARHGNADPCPAERQQWGLDHAQAGGLLAERWNLGPDITAAINGHHEPQRVAVDLRRWAACVHVADAIAGEDAVTDAGKPMHLQALEELGLESVPRSQLVAAMSVEYQRAQVFRDLIG